MQRNAEWDTAKGMWEVIEDRKQAEWVSAKRAQLEFTSRDAVFVPITLQPSGAWGTAAQSFFDHFVSLVGDAHSGEVDWFDFWKDEPEPEVENAQPPALNALREKQRQIKVQQAEATTAVDGARFQSFNSWRDEPSNEEWDTRFQVFEKDAIQLRADLQVRPTFSPLAIC